MAARKRRKSNATRKRAPVRAPKARRARGKRGGSRAVQVERAVQTLGRRVKAGPVVVGRTRRVTPTKRGFGAFLQVAKDVNRAQRMRARPGLYTATLKIRLRGPNGRFVKVPPLVGIGLPLPAQVQAARQRGETEAETYARLIETRIRQAVFRQADLMLGDYKETRAGQQWERARLRGDWKSARSALRRIKARRDVTYQVDFVRQLTGEGDADGEDFDT